MIFFNGKQMLMSGDSIGGRNYIKHSSDFSSNWGIVGNGGAVLDDTYLGGKVVKLVNKGDANNNLSQLLPKELSEQNIVWSCFAKADNAGDFLHTEPWGSHGRKNQALTTEWKRYNFGGKVVSENQTIFFWGQPTNKGNVYIALPKLELGPIATDWTPAPEDFLNK